MTLTKLLRDCGLAVRATAHGFRSCFRDWAAERTNAPHAVMEKALAHVVADAVEAGICPFYAARAAASVDVRMGPFRDRDRRRRGGAAPWMTISTPI